MNNLSINSVMSSEIDDIFNLHFFEETITIKNLAKLEGSKIILYLGFDKEN